MPKSPRRIKTTRSETANSLNRIQDLQVSAVRRVSEAVARLVPPLPRPPLADRLPGAKRIVNGNFNRARRLLENQRRFTLALVEAVEPVTRRLGERKEAKKKSKARGPVKVEPKRGAERHEAS